jgi:SAM-dependent methyltransferase
LAPLAPYRVGVEPAMAMLAHGRDVAPGATFVAASAELLPFADGSFDLMTAAGALNYADIERFLPEAARVLAPEGLLVVYDFSGGRRIAGDSRLDDWFSEFEARYPYAPGYALDVRGLPWPQVGLRLLTYRDYEVRIAMTLPSYLAYVLSETNVEAAIRAGTSEREITDWCRSTLEPFFPRPSGEVCFEGYCALVGRSAEGTPDCGEAS